VSQGCQESNAMAFSQSLDGIQSPFHISLALDALQNIAAQMSDSRRAAGEPVEGVPAGVDLDMINAWSTSLEAVIHGLARGLVFHMNRTGSSDLADRPREVSAAVSGGAAESPCRFVCTITQRTLRWPAALRRTFHPEAIHRGGPDHRAPFVCHAYS
jgi:hypothetical protein